MAARNTRGVCSQYSRLGICTYGSRCKFRHVQITPTRALSFPTYQNVEEGSEEDNESNGSPLERFFAKYSRSGFEHSPEKPVIDEFERLCSVLGLDPDDKDDDDVLAVRNGLKDAMVLQFNSIYGTNVYSLTSWQSLCRVLGISPVPTTLDECKELVINTHVNIVDLVDAGGTQVVTVFPSEKALSTYTLENRKIFPRQNVHAGGLLRALLRRILHPPDEPKQQRLARKNRKKRSRGHRG